jgi:putative effector of murein hydrolase
MTEFLDDLFGLAFFFGPSIAAFALATFSPLRQLRQPAKLIVIGSFSGAVGAFFSILEMSRGTVSSRAVFLITGISIAVGALITLLATGQTISEKSRDEIVKKSDDQSWRA